MNLPVAIVLAAGKGTRMKSELPKVLCEANGRPLVQYVIDALKRAGVARFVVVVGYRAELVEAALAGDDSIQFAMQTEQLGTGHAVMMCRDLIEDHQGAVVVVAGDSPMLQADSIRHLLQEYEATRPACVLGSLIHPDPTGLGRIVRDPHGKFVGIVEHKDATPQQLQISETNMSTYVFDCQKMLAALDQLTDSNQQREYYITDLPAILLHSNEDVRALPVLKPIEALSVNTVEHLAEVEAAMRKTAGVAG
jgi:bifunctional UDP-N-acetylglucosamine pyrophosphorylase / glucosamine-1-phosphate N-acetyltransferase